MQFRLGRDLIHITVYMKKCNGAIHLQVFFTCCYFSLSFNFKSTIISTFLVCGFCNIDPKVSMNLDQSSQDQATDYCGDINMITWCSEMYDLPFMLSLTYSNSVYAIKTVNGFPAGCHVILITVKSMVEVRKAISLL